MTDKQWRKIFKALEVDILDRRGIKWEWEKIEREVVNQEIKPAWRKIIEEGLKDGA